MKGRVVAGSGGGGLREDEKKADRERETAAGARAAGRVRRRRVRGDEDRDHGGLDGGVPDDDEVGDEVLRTWSRTSREPRAECTRNEAAAGARRRTDPFSSD